MTGFAKASALAYGEDIRALAQNSRILRDSIQGLTNIAKVHERRIGDLEDQH